HRRLEEMLTDPLTKLGNRRKLSADLEARLAEASASAPLMLALFDLDGFKGYNDTFGHLAGDALLARLGAKLKASVDEHGSAYRLGGDEFCVLLSAPAGELERALAAAADALKERGGELHDIGKVGIPGAILAKVTPLSEAESEYVSRYTLLGERILASIPALRGVAALVRSSRERWDGGGHPDGLAGEQIPLGSR